MLELTAIITTVDSLERDNPGPSTDSLAETVANAMSLTERRINRNG